MAKLPLPFPWPAAALAVLLGAACATPPPTPPPNYAPADGAPVASASAASPTPTDLPTPAATSVAEAAPAPFPNLAPARPPLPKPPPRHVDCDPGGPPPLLCVAPSETEGAPATSLTTGHAGGCRSAPKADICRGCRPDFVKFDKGKCCYQGLSRLPLCENLPSDER